MMLICIKNSAVRQNPEIFRKRPDFFDKDCFYLAVKGER